jgi:maltose alpha-D-glucosyltransferase/alpha-amylase
MANAEREPVARAIESITSDELVRYLAKQRWFAAKGAAPTSARIADMVVLPWGGGAFAVARAVVDVGGAEHAYQLTLAAREQPPANVDDRAVLKPGLYDAAHDEEFRSGLAAALAEGGSAESDAARWVATPVAAPVAAAGTIARDAQSKVGSAEQSNTSIVFGDAAILKLFRMLKSGDNPDVEVTEFLTTRAEFPHTPRLLGTIEYTVGDTRFVAGMLQQYLPGSSDAWSFALDRGRAYFDAPIDRDPPNAFVADARRLGVITRELHEALATDDDDPAFAADAATPEDVDRWAHRTQQSIRDALTLLAKQLEAGTVPKDRVAEATALVSRRDHFLGWINEIDDTIGDDLGMRTRVHGDYHLWQVLRTSSNDFMVIDFEGEPSRSIDERREKTSPLRDVAGMLRSLAYAAATLAMAAKNIDPRTRELRVARWERDVRNAFLAGSLAARVDAAPDVLPEDEANVRRLIALFEAEKAFYELSYELNNRPAWAWIPMRGISKLFLAQGSEGVRGSG